MGLSLELNNGKTIQDTDADLWFEALQYAVEFNSYKLAEIYHKQAQSLIELFIDVEKAIEKDKYENYCEGCNHSKIKHYETGEMLPLDYYGDGKQYPEWRCEGEDDYCCDCNDLVVPSECEQK